MLESKTIPTKRFTVAPGRLERTMGRLDAFLARAVAEPNAWWRAIVLWLLRLALRFVAYCGRTFPFIYRPVYHLCQFVQRRLDARLAVKKRETVRTLFLRRLFTMPKPMMQHFRNHYAFVNVVTFILFVWYVPLTLADAIYAYGTYPFGTYRDVIVTQAYRNITNQSTYAVHGYEMLPDGNKKEIYLELGTSIWFWNLYPEFTFGQIPILGRCTFETYGISLRIPRPLRFFSGALYVLNPWIVNMQCVPPTIVPADPSKG